MNKKFYITTSIPYVNADPHIGFAMEAVQADTIARYQRLSGSEVWFLSGTDENALKNVQAAEKANKPTKEFINERAENFYKLKDSLNLNWDDFIRTTEGRHFSGAQKLWRMFKEEDIYKKKYKGLYCVGCEQFYEPEELDNNRCPIHLKDVEQVEEENYFFKLSNYQQALEELIESNKLNIIPQIRKNEVLSFIKGGLKDISISRSVERAKGWGVPVPDDANQIQYVWVDALSNYITALGFTSNSDLYANFWENNPNRTHIIGKDIVRFHAIYWPAFLISANLPLPTTIYVHGFITTHGQKISKSLGNVIDPFDQVSKYTTDAVRYFLLREIPAYGDGDYTEERFKEVYNSELANGLGNLVARVAKLCEQCEGEFSTPKTELTDKEFEDVRNLLDKFKFNEAIGEIWNWISAVDKQIEETKPWTLTGESLKNVLQPWVSEIIKIATALQPFLPNTAEKILKQFKGPEIKSVPSLFPRIK